MEIHVGWATEFAREKFDITLDEADLMALLVESGIPEDRLPDAMREATFGEKFQILELAARRYAGLEQERMFRGQPSMSDERRAGILKTAKSLMEEQRRIVGIVKQRLGIDGD